MARHTLIGLIGVDVLAVGRHLLPHHRPRRLCETDMDSIQTRVLSLNPVIRAPPLDAATMRAAITLVPLGGLVSLLSHHLCSQCLAERSLSRTELESGNAVGTFLQTPAPVLDKVLALWVQEFYPVLGFNLAPSLGQHNSHQYRYWIKSVSQMSCASTQWACACHTGCLLHGHAAGAWSPHFARVAREEAASLSHQAPLAACLDLQPHRWAGVQLGCHCV